MNSCLIDLRGCYKDKHLLLKKPSGRLNSLVFSVGSFDELVVGYYEGNREHIFSGTVIGYGWYILTTRTIFEKGKALKVQFYDFHRQRHRLIYPFTGQKLTRQIQKQQEFQSQKAAALNTFQDYVNYKNALRNAQQNNQQCVELQRQYNQLQAKWRSQCAQMSFRSWIVFKLTHQIIQYHVPVYYSIADATQIGIYFLQLQDLSNQYNNSLIRQRYALKRFFFKTGQDIATNNKRSHTISYNDWVQYDVQTQQYCLGAPIIFLDNNGLKFVGINTINETFGNSGLLFTPRSRELINSSLY